MKIILFDWCGLFIDNKNTNLINTKIRYINDYICHLSEISIIDLFENEPNDQLIYFFENFL